MGSNGSESKRPDLFRNIPELVEPDAKLKEAYFFATAAFSFEPAVSLTEWPAGIWIASPVWDRNLFTLGNLVDENLEDCIQNTVDGNLRVFGLRCNSSNKFATVHSQCMVLLD